MRALRILSGIAVLFTTLHLAHAMHHFYSLDMVHGLGFWAGMAFAGIIGILSLFGGCLLLMSGR
jgi:hypothetical protein